MPIFRQVLITWWKIKNHMIDTDPSFNVKYIVMSQEMFNSQWSLSINLYQPLHLGWCEDKLQWLNNNLTTALLCKLSLLCWRWGSYQRSVEGNRLDPFITDTTRTFFTPPICQWEDEQPLTPEQGISVSCFRNHINTHFKAHKKTWIFIISLVEYINGRS